MRGSELKLEALRNLRRFCILQNYSYVIENDVVKIFSRLKWDNDILYAETSVSTFLLNEADGGEYFYRECIDKIRKGIEHAVDEANIGTI